VVVVLRGLILEAHLTETLAVQAAARMVTLMLAQVVQETRLRHQALLILMPCKDLLAGQILLLLRVMRLPEVVAVQVGRGALLQELLFPVAVRLVVLVLFLHYLAPL
jgi:hypothetical protein